MLENLTIAIVAAIAGKAVAETFPPVQWLKDKIGLSQYHWEIMAEAMGGETMVRRIKRNAAKLLNCTPCTSFWACIAIALPIVGWWAMPCAVLSHTLGWMVAGK